MKGRFVTNIAGALIEAWDELRIHKLRVLLSLVGVAVAVGAMTLVLGIGQIFGQASSEFMERIAGRQVTLTANAYNTTGPADAATMVTAFRGATERFAVDHSSVVANTTTRVQGDRATISPSLILVDPSYGIIHRSRVLEGRWLEQGDTGRRAPAVVVNEKFISDAGLADLADHPTITIPGDPGFIAQVVGVIPDDQGQWTQPQMIALYDSWVAASSAGGVANEGQDGSNVIYEAWVSPEMATAGQQSIQSFLRGQLGENYEVSVFSNVSDEFAGVTRTFSTVVLVVGVLVLALGALSLVNITLVTVKYRVREIGIRRSFGATSSRIFFSIMLESVVATAAAGLVGVGLAVWAVRWIPFEQLTGMPVQDIPPFPMSTALTGLIAATAVGALAGLLPALYAVRIRPVDAIRT